MALALFSFAIPLTVASITLELSLLIAARPVTGDSHDIPLTVASLLQKTLVFQNCFLLKLPVCCQKVEKLWVFHEIMMTPWYSLTFRN